MDRDPYEHAPAPNDGLSAQGLMTVITALPGDRLNGLMDRARRQAPRRPAPHLATLPLADAIRSARVGACMSQVVLAAALGVRRGGRITPGEVHAALARVSPEGATRPGRR